MRETTRAASLAPAPQELPCVRETALLADATIVTTRELGAFVQALQKPVHVVPNGFDVATWRHARLAVRRRATDWISRNGARFNRVVVLQNLVNSGLGLTRNAGFAAAETPYVIPLDADNRLLPKCLGTCLAAIQAHGAAFAYPSIHQFGDIQQVVGAEAYWPARRGGGNFIDAMALVAKSAWAAAGGYDHVRFGWEDYDFWCRLAALGMWGTPIADILCEYRVHAASMLRRSTDIEANKLELAKDLERRHHWVNVSQALATKAATKPPRRRKSRPSGQTGESRLNAVAASGDTPQASDDGHRATARR